MHGFGCVPYRQAVVGSCMIIDYQLVCTELCNDASFKTHHVDA